jgi:hypothetical protein
MVCLVKNGVDGVSGVGVDGVPEGNVSSIKHPAIALILRVREGSVFCARTSCAWGHRVCAPLTPPHLPRFMNLLSPRALSDVDGDGQLSCEEFVLALHLCELTKAGNPLPATLPPKLIPPTQRRASLASLGSGGLGSGGAPGTPTEGEVLKQNEWEAS